MLSDEFLSHVHIRILSKGWQQNLEGLAQIVDGKLEVLVPIVQAKSIPIFFLGGCFDVEHSQQVQHYLEAYSFLLQFLKLLPKQDSDSFVEWVFSQLIVVVECLHFDGLG